MHLFASAPNPCRLLIIAPSKFASALQPLLQHKNQTGMPAHLITLSSIVGNQLSPGRHPWMIKQAIAEGHMHHGVYYVMLVGDASQFPTRHRFVKQGDGGMNEGMTGSYNPTDHYYADLYNIGGAAAGVSDWDADRDGFYNLSTWTYDQAHVDGSPRTNNPDQVDGFPNVAVGRVPAHTEQDVKNYVGKVIEYELGMRARSIPAFEFLCDQNFPNSPESCDGMITNAGLASLPNVEIAKGWGNLPEGSSPPAGWPSWSRFGSPETEKHALTAKWLVHVGHGNTLSWVIATDAAGTMSNGHIKNWKESYAYPIVLSAGCDTGAFLNWAPNDGPYRGLAPDKRYEFVFNKVTRTVTDSANGTTTSWPLPVPAPHPYDFPNVSERTLAYAWLCANANGGAIAYAGASLTQQGAVYGGALFMRVLRQAGAMNILGDAWVQGQRDYLAEQLSIRGAMGPSIADEIIGAPRIFLGVQTLFGDPSLRLNPVTSHGLSAIMANERLTVFARTAHGTLTHKYFDSLSGNWTDWIHLGDGQISSGPSAVMANDRLTVFARSAHGTLTHKFYDPTQAKWTNWSHLEEQEMSAAPCAVMAGDRLTVFARSLGGTLTHRFYDSLRQGWTTWIPVGNGRITSAPSAVMAGARLTVFARSEQGRLTHKYFDPQRNAWTDWIELGTQEMASAPSAVMAGERLTVFARALDGTLMHLYYDPEQGQWLDDWIRVLPGRITSAPAAVMAGDRLTVFARTEHGTLTHTFYDLPRQGWIDWYHLGEGQIS